MKTIAINELRERGLKPGDLFNIEWDWYAVDEGGYFKIEEQVHHIQLSSSLPFERMWEVVFREQIPTNAYILFVRKLDRRCILGHRLKVIPGQEYTYIEAVHFGNSKEYTWKVPERLNQVKFQPGDIVEVDTAKGNQLVEVRTVYKTYRNFPSKEVISLVKADDLPF